MDVLRDGLLTSASMSLIRDGYVAKDPEKMLIIPGEKTIL